ncbi:hypothetical protein C8R44DRAFT_739326 [Mycena epipterygia]|nr:hypothetical protein C8R44DRAFT_739326 [Mycena epipterygia]
MAKVRPLIHAIVQQDSYAYPTSTRSVPAGVRVLTQSQMAAFRLSGDPVAWINKLYTSSPSGEALHCFFELATEESIHKSKWYFDSDSLENTIAVLLYSLEQLHTHPGQRMLPSHDSDTLQAAGSSVTASASWVKRLVFALDPFKIFSFFWFFWDALMSIARTLSGKTTPCTTCHFFNVDPTRRSCILMRGDTCLTVFDEVAGVGATGTTLRSRAEKKIVKFGDPRKILHEALIYEKLAKAHKVGNPALLGSLAIIIEDVGDPIEITALTSQQRFDLAQSIRRLHELGVHHHDVLGNTMIGEDGTIRLVDFGAAELVPLGATCNGCDDTRSKTTKVYAISAGGRPRWKIYSRNRIAVGQGEMRQSCKVVVVVVVVDEEWRDKRAQSEAGHERPCAAS